MRYLRNRIFSLLSSGSPEYTACNKHQKLLRQNVKKQEQVHGMKRKNATSFVLTLLRQALQLHILRQNGQASAIASTESSGYLL